MTHLSVRKLGSLVFVSALASCGGAGDVPDPTVAAAGPTAAAVDARRLAAAHAEPGQWMATGRTYDEQRFSPLAQIDVDNVAELGLAWYGDLRMPRAQEATPLYIDGVLYVTTAWSNVQAYDARSGALLWSFDAKVPREWGSRACCDVVNRGAAAWDGKVFVGTIDGRLLAIDA